LAELAATHQLVHHVPVKLEFNGPVQPLPPEIALALLRTAQESLVNAARHSPGQPVTLELSYDLTHTQLQVSNPLREPGSAPSASPGLEAIGGGYGLLGMRERLLLLHGSLTASARAGMWEVTAEVPR